MVQHRVRALSTGAQHGGHLLAAASARNSVRIIDEGQQQQQQSSHAERSTSLPVVADQLDEAADENCDRLVLDYMNKKSFTCLLVGARQTGKRTIVKCFVKLLNEFKLAAFEYRKEKMLSKLMSCRQRLRNLEEQNSDELGEPQAEQPARARIHSWLGAGPVHKLLNLPKVKRRLNSVASQVPHLYVDEQADEQNCSASLRRRHTAFDQSLSGSNQAHSEQRSSSNRYLNVEADQGFALGASNNKSESNIDQLGESIELHKLQIPVPTSSTSEIGHRNSYSSRSSTQFLSPSQPQMRASICTQASQFDARHSISLKELNRKKTKIRFKTRRQLNAKYLPETQSGKQDNNNNNNHLQDLPDSFIVVYSINDRSSFHYAKTLISSLRSIRTELHMPIILVANKIDLERAKEVKIEEGRLLARKNACKFMEISCTVGFNLDNLLVGLRTQLILRHHKTLNCILRRGKIVRPVEDAANRRSDQTKSGEKSRSNNNILVRLYKRYLNDSHETSYDCDNFSKL